MDIKTLGPAFKTKDVHVSTIKAGDIVHWQGQWRTVDPEYIKSGGFMGASIFGDNYRSGTLPVKKAVYLDPLKTSKGGM